MSTLILCFHRVADQESGGRSKLAISPEDFNFVLDTVGKKYDFVSLAEGVKPSKQRLAVVTFDDGYADNLHTAAPILRERGIPATFFIATAYVGSKFLFAPDVLDDFFNKHDGEELRQLSGGVLAGNYWEDLETLTALADVKFWELMEKLSETARASLLEGDPLRRPVSYKELTTLAAIPGLSIAPHTVSHRRLSRLSSAEARAEVEQSARWVKSSGLNSLPFFAYPFGQATDVVADLTAHASGLGLVALTTFPTLVTPQSMKAFGPVGVPRLSVGPEEVGIMPALVVLLPAMSRVPKAWLGLLRFRRWLRSFL